MPEAETGIAEQRQLSTLVDAFESAHTAADMQPLTRQSNGRLAWEWRLARLRDGARTAARTATLTTSVSALLLSLLLGYFSYSALSGLASMARTAQDLQFLQSVAIVSLIVLLRGFVPAVALLLTAWRLYPYYYRDTWRRLLHCDEALLYTNEDYLQLLSEARHKLTTHFTSAVPRVAPRTLEQHLEYCACHCDLLRQASRGTVAASARSFTTGFTTLLFQRIFKLPLPTWATVMVGGALPLAALVLLPSAPVSQGPLVAAGAIALLLLGVPVALALSLGPQYIISRARLVALLDSLTERPAIDVQRLAPPVEPRWSWLRPLAHWTSFEEAPD